MDNPEKDLFNFTYGYVEASWKLPTLPGSWPAFWMLQGGWPPEVDIMEYPIFTSAMNYSKYNIAFHYTNSSGGNSSYGPGLFDPGAGNLTTSWHTYGMEWTSTYVKFYFDGSVKSTITDTTAIAQLQSMYLLLTNGWGTWPGLPTLDQWPSGASDKAQVDWVRVWKKTDTYPSSITWTKAADGTWDDSTAWLSGNVPQLATQTATFPSVAASNVTVDWTNSRTVGGVVFNSGVNYTLGSGNDSIMLTSASPIAANGQPNSNTVLIDASGATGAGPNVINSRLELYNNVTIRSPNKPMTIGGNIIGLGSLRS